MILMDRKLINPHFDFSSIEDLEKVLKNCYSQWVNLQQYWLSRGDHIIEHQEFFSRINRVVIIINKYITFLSKQEDKILVKALMFSDIPGMVSYLLEVKYHIDNSESIENTFIDVFDIEIAIDVCLAIMEFGHNGANASLKATFAKFKDLDTVMQDMAVEDLKYYYFTG